MSCTRFLQQGPMVNHMLSSRTPKDHVLFPKQETAHTLRVLTTRQSQQRNAPYRPSWKWRPGLQLEESRRVIQDLRLGLSQGALPAQHPPLPPQHLALPDHRRVPSLPSTRPSKPVPGCPPCPASASPCPAPGPPSTCLLGCHPLPPPVRTKGPES